MEEFDVTIVGAGLAGLQLAQLLAQSGLRVALADRKRSVGEAVHTTGIFVRKTLEDFDLPGDCLGPPIRHVTLYSPDLRKLDVASTRDEFRIGRMRRLYDRLLKQCLRSGVEWLPDMRYVSYAETTNGATITFDTHDGLRRIHTHYLVGADGATSRVAADLALDRNREWIVGLEEVYERIKLKGLPRLYCFLNPQLAPGYIAWFVNDGEETHLGVGGYASKFEPTRALNLLRERVTRLLDVQLLEPVDRRSGRIPVNGILPRIANERGLLVGDAAGAVSPLTAGGLDACMRLSSFAAQVIQEFLHTSDARTLSAYSGERFRARFISRLWMRRMISTVHEPAIIELAATLLRIWPFHALARHIFFGRGSFPNIELEFPSQASLATREIAAR